MRQLPIHHTVQLDQAGIGRRSSNVLCPARDSWIPLLRCVRCPTCAHLSMPRLERDWLLLCNADATDEVRSSGTVDQAIEPTVLCVGASTPALLAARALDENGLQVALVVDGDGHPVGVISRERLRGGPTGATTGTLSTAAVTIVLETADAALARDLAARDPSGLIAVVSGGRVIGVVTAIPPGG